MCGLFAARTKRDIIELSKENLHRGSRTHSITTFKNGQISIVKFNGQFDSTNVPDSADYYICHIQAPTNTSAKAHPAHVVVEENGSDYDSYVWHNGILKDQYMSDKPYSWDTEYMAHALPYGKIDEFDGSFACFHYINHNLHVFRNEISPLFYGEDGQFSSTRTILTPFPLEPNKMFNINLDDYTMYELYTFKTVNNPYFFL